MKLLFLAAMFISQSVRAQQNAVTLDEAVSAALSNNPAVQASAYETKRLEALTKGSISIPKTDVMLMHGQYNSIVSSDNSLTISQSIPFPTVFGSQRKLNNSLASVASLRELITKNEMAYQVRLAFNKLLYLQSLREVLTQQDSLVSQLLQAATVRHKVGDATLLEMTTYQAQHLQMSNLLLRNDQEINSSKSSLRLLCQLPLLDTIEGDLRNDFTLLKLPDTALTVNPEARYARKKAESAAYETRLESMKALPDLHIGYFNQSLIGLQTVNGSDQYFDASKRFQGFTVGVSLPLWFIPHTARVKAATYNEAAMKKNAEAVELNIANAIEQALGELRKNQGSMTYFESYGLSTAELLITQSRKAYEQGEIDTITMLINLKQALSTKQDYLSAVFARNENIIIIKYLTGH